jgi:hypothetical protein
VPSLLGIGPHLASPAPAIHARVAPHREAAPARARYGMLRILALDAGEQITRWNNCDFNFALCTKHGSWSIRDAEAHNPS